MITPAVLGYMAGMIDGDGTIYLRSSNAREGKKRASVTVRNTHEPLIRQLETWAGGIIIHWLPPCDPDCTKAHLVHRRKQSWKWEANGLRGLIVLKNIQPYLIEKQHKADEVLVDFDPQAYLTKAKGPSIIHDMTQRGWTV